MKTKQQLRINILQQLTSLSKHEKKEIEYKLQTRLFQQPFWQQAQTIGITYSTSREWDTKAIIQQAWDEEKIVALPISNQLDKTLQFVEVNDFAELDNGYANILEPKKTAHTKSINSQIELLIVPGVMFDYEGYRLGYGGGFYDRYLSEPNHRSLNVSLASQFQIVEKLPTDIYDIPIDYIITEAACLKIEK